MARRSFSCAPAPIITIDLKFYMNLDDPTGQVAVSSEFDFFFVINKLSVGLFFSCWCH